MVDNILQPKTCTKCRQAQPVSEFDKRVSTRDGKCGWCKSCCRVAARASRFRRPTTYLLHKARTSAKRRGLPFDLYEHKDWIRAKVDAGVCELTGVPFDFSGDRGSPYAPSLDRIDSSKGYTRGNVRLVCFALNVAMNVWGFAPVEHMMETRRRLLEEILS